MKHLLQLVKKRRCVIPVRIYHTLSTIGTLCVSSVIAAGISTLLLQCFSLDFAAAHMIFCLLTVLLGSVALAWEAKYYIYPAKAVTDASVKVANGDFNVSVPFPTGYIIIKEGAILIENFNRMVNELKGMEEMQRDFTSSVSHEFKTPLSAIAGFTELLADGGLSEHEQREYLTLVHDESLRMSRLAENILRLSRLDAQEIIERREQVAVDEQIRQAWILLTEHLDGRAPEPDIYLPEIFVESDPDLLEQIWLNLIDNALKYSPSGKTLHITGSVATDTVIIQIRDEGDGISPDKLPHIFDRFYQCEESHKSQGNGLGLSIVKRIVEMLGGIIECRSELGIGTEMKVTLQKK